MKSGKDYTSQKSGKFPIKLHRRIKGKVKGVIIKRTKSGKWYAIVQVEEEPKPLPKTGKVVGIDLGVKHFSVDSDGNAFETHSSWRSPLRGLRKFKCNSRGSRKAQRIGRRRG